MDTPYLVSMMMVFVGFPEDLCLFFSIHSFFGRMSKLNNRYWLETEHFFNEKNSNIHPETPYNVSKFKTPLSRFEIFRKSKMFCTKPLYIAHNILTSLFYIEKVLICELVTKTLLN